MIIDYGDCVGAAVRAIRGLASADYFVQITLRSGEVIESFELLEFDDTERQLRGFKVDADGVRMGEVTEVKVMEIKEIQC